MKVKTIGITAAALASAASIAFVGTASAAATPNSVPTVNYQVCGNVYAGAWNENAAPPDPSTGIQNAQVTASLFDKNKNPVSLPGGVSPVATTDSAGRYCITDTSGTLVSTVTSGGYVKLALTTLPAGHTLVPASKSPWKSTGLFGSDEIGVGTFLTHKISGLDSAYNFHFATT